MNQKSWPPMPWMPFLPLFGVFPKHVQKNVDERRKNSSKPAFPHGMAHDAGDNRPGKSHTMGNSHIAEQPVLNSR